MLLLDDMREALKTDKTGTYYSIKLFSKTIQKNGGAGTVGLFNVYRNGTYKLKN
jgi:hypothetical protein